MADLQAAFALASKAGLQLTGPINFEAKEKAVRWNEFSLEYTFIIFTMVKLGPENRERN
jgi:hypothetical protein